MDITEAQLSQIEFYKKRMVSEFAYGSIVGFLLGAAFGIIGTCLFLSYIH